MQDLRLLRIRHQRRRSAQGDLEKGSMGARSRCFRSKAACTHVGRSNELIDLASQQDELDYSYTAVYINRFCATRQQPSLVEWICAHDHGETTTKPMIHSTLFIR